MNQGGGGMGRDDGVVADVIGVVVGTLVIFLLTAVVGTVVVVGIGGILWLMGVGG